MDVSLVEEIDALIQEIEDFVHSPEDATAVDIQKLLNERTRLKKELKRLNTENVPPARSTPEVTTSETNGNNEPLPTSHKRTSVTIFPTSNGKVKVVLNPKLPGITSKEFYLILKATETGEAKLCFTNLPCFIPFNINKTSFKECTHQAVELLEAYLLRKHYFELTREEYSPMLHSALQASFPCDFIQFGVNISTEAPVSHGYIMFCLFYKMDEIYARDVYVRFEGSEEFISSVEKDIEEQSLLFKSCSLHEAFHQIF